MRFGVATRFSVLPRGRGIQPLTFGSVYERLHVHPSVEHTGMRACAWKAQMQLCTYPHTKRAHTHHTQILIHTHVFTRTRTCTLHIHTHTRARLFTPQAPVEQRQQRRGRQRRRREGPLVWWRRKSRLSQTPPRRRFLASARLAGGRGLRRTRRYLLCVFASHPFHVCAHWLGVYFSASTSFSRAFFLGCVHGPSKRHLYCGASAQGILTLFLDSPRRRHSRSQHI